MSIKDIMPHPGTHGKFGIRDKVLQEVLKRGKHLEVVFKERPELIFKMNPLRWGLLGEKKKQVGLYKSDPMVFLWFYIGLNDELSAPTADPNQEVLL